MALVRRIERTIGRKTGARDRTLRAFDDRCCTLEQRGGFVEAALIADLQREFGQRRADRSRVRPEQPGLDRQRVAIGCFGLRVIVSATVKPALLDEMLVVAEIGCPGLENARRELCLQNRHAGL